MGTDVIGGPHDFLPTRSDRSDEFQKKLLTALPALSLT
jgi:hypothetical protein